MFANINHQIGMWSRGGCASIYLIKCRDTHHTKFWRNLNPSFLQQDKSRHRMLHLFQKCCVSNELVTEEKEYCSHNQSSKGDGEDNQLEIFHKLWLPETQKIIKLKLNESTQSWKSGQVDHLVILAEVLDNNLGTLQEARIVENPKKKLKPPEGSQTRHITNRCRRSTNTTYFSRKKRHEKELVLHLTGRINKDLFNLPDPQISISLHHDL